MADTFVKIATVTVGAGGLPMLLSLVFLLLTLICN